MSKYSWLPRPYPSRNSCPLLSGDVMRTCRACLTFSPSSQTRVDPGQARVRLGEDLARFVGPGSRGRDLPRRNGRLDSGGWPVLPWHRQEGKCRLCCLRAASFARTTRVVRPDQEVASARVREGGSRCGDREELDRRDLNYLSSANSLFESTFIHSNNEEAPSIVA